MKQEIINKIKKLKLKYEPEGFILLGLFGSFARGEETKQSDLDLLFELNETFINHYIGWDAYGRIEEIKKEFIKETGREIDFADKNALTRIGKKYILPEVEYV